MNFSRWFFAAGFVLIFTSGASAQPLNGAFDVGGGALEYNNVVDAVADLAARGIDGWVLFNVYAGTYDGVVTIPAITGASAANTISFLESSAPAILTASAGAGTLVIDGGDYITFDGIDIAATNSNTHAVFISGDADYNIIRNCSVTGWSVSFTNTRGIVISGAGPDHNRIQSVTVSGGHYAIDMSGTSGAGSQIENEIEACTITEGKYGVYLTYQHGARVHDCDIQPGYTAFTEIFGVYVGALNADDTCRVYANRIHNFRVLAVNSANGILAVTVAGRALIYNNFIYGFNTSSTSGAIYGLRLGSGTTASTAEFYFNSVRINDVTTSGNIAAFWETNASCVAILENNILQLDEPTTTCWGIYHNAGQLTSDYNCVYGTGTGFIFGRSNTVNRATLALWQANTDFDDHSVDGDPLFIGDTDLHIDPVNSVCQDAGTPIADVTDDIDGDPRNPATPDIGADEAGETPPDPVTDLTCLRDGETNDVVLYWSATANAGSYLIYAGTTPDFAIEPASQIGTTGSTLFTHTGTVATHAKLFYVVIASTAPPGPAR